jgi:hypothetical protein
LVRGERGGACERDVFVDLRRVAGDADHVALINQRHAAANRQPPRRAAASVSRGFVDNGSAACAHEMSAPIESE